MTKKFISLLAVMLCAFTAIGCGQESKKFIAGSPENIAWAVEIYEKVLATMPTQSYVATTSGSGVVNTVGINITLNIRGKTIHKPGEIYTENMSNGDAMLGINTSFAKRVYYKSSSGQEIYRLASTTGKKPTDGSGNIVIEESQWGKAADITKIDYEEKFGKPINRLSNYVISADTILDTSSGVTSHDDTKYVFQFVLDVSAGLISPSIAGYAKQIHTMSERKCVSFDYVSVTFTVSNDYRILQCAVEESYTVNAGFVKPTTTNNLSYAFDYPDNLQVPTF